MQKYLKAKCDLGSEKLNLLKVLFFGPPGAGKTTLLNVLLNLDIKVLRESTGVLDPKLVQFKISVQKQTEKSISHWKKIEIDEEILRFRDTIKKIIDARTPLILQQNSNLSDLEPDMKIDEKLQSVVDGMTSENQSQHFITSNTLIACYDSGGQPEFFDVMPAFITATTGNIMIFDMSKDLHSKLNPEFFKEGQHLGSSDVQTHYTGAELLKTALANIQSYATKYSSHSTANSNSQKSKLLVVGTHLDLCGDTEDEKCKNICAIEKIIRDDVLHDCSGISLIERRKGANTIIIHPIANKCDQDSSSETARVREEAAQEIRTAIENMSKNRNINEEVPISWLLFQYEIKLHGGHCILRRDCDKIAEKSYIDIEDVDDILLFFHELGILLYYKDIEKLRHVVFSDPQWLFSQLNRLIEIKYRPFYGEEESIKNGIFKEEFLAKIYEEKLDTKNVLRCEDIFILFVHLNIMATLSDATEQYFMPALLDPAPDNILIDTTFGKQAFSTLFIKFKDGFFPRGVFCCLIALCINKNRSWKLQRNETYKDLVVFQIENNDEYLILSDKINYVSLQIYGKEDLAQNRHRVICCTLCENLKEVCDRIHLNGEFKFGFLCKRDKKFANIQEQHPCYPENLFCSHCHYSPMMTSDQLVWFISPKLLDIFEKVSVHKQMLSSFYYAVCSYSYVFRNCTSPYTS